MTEAHHAPNPSTALARVVVDELARCGVRHVVVAPGSRSGALALALHDDERLDVHVHVDERSAGFVALGIARATGTASAVVTTSGSAVANLHPAVIEADTARVPLVLLTADRPPELRHTGANQAIDQAGIFGRAVRWSIDIAEPSVHPEAVATWRSSVARAVAAAHGLEASPGPVQVNLGFREPTVPLADDGRSRAAPYPHPLDPRADGRPWVEVWRAPARPGDDVVAALADEIASTPRGLIVTGATPTDPDAVLALSQAAGWPVLAEPAGRMRCDPRVVVHGHHLLGHGAFAAAHRPELVIRIGRTSLSPVVERALGHDVRQVLIDPHGAWDDPARTLAGIVIADAAATCRALSQRIEARGDDTWMNAWRDADASVTQAIDGILDADEVPSEPRTARDVGRALASGGVLVVASSMPVRDADRFLEAGGGVEVVSNRGASGIDGAVSTTLGVALGVAQRREPTPVVGLLGDLALLHDLNGLLLDPLTAIDAVLVVVDNDGGGIFSFLPQAGFEEPFERLFATPHGREFARAAELHRTGYHRVETASTLIATVRAALAAGGLHIVHVRTERAANLELHRAIDRAATAALDTLV